MMHRPVRIVTCDLCGRDERMKEHHNWVWDFKLPKGWVTVDKSNFFENKSKEYCQKCVKVLKG